MLKSYGRGPLMNNQIIKTYFPVDCHFNVTWYFDDALTDNKHMEELLLFFCCNRA